MANKHEEYWEHVAPHLRRHLGLHRPSLEEAKAIFEAAEEAALSDAELDSMIAFAQAGKEPQAKKPQKASWFDNLDLGSTRREMALAYNRNASDEDPEASRVMDQLRAEALADGNEDEEDQDLLPDEGEERNDSE